MKYFILTVIAILSFTSIAMGQDVPPAAQPMNLMQMILHYVDALAQIMFGLMIVATAAARLIPGNKDDEKVHKAIASAQKVLGYLPTFGINPRTKKLEEALASMKTPKEETKETE